jgi:predicted SAM-dependent methyltransferase
MDAAARTRIVESIAGCSRLHIGCGFNFVPGWINVGLFEEDFLAYGAVTENNGLVLHVDITKDFPFQDDALTAIYASHFIEHFSFEEGLSLARTFHASLKQGGIARLTFPDLEIWVRKYFENDGQFFEKYKGFFVNSPRTKIRTKGEVFMSQLHGWGHKWGYDYESAAHLLTLAGFSQVERKTLHQSAIPDIKRVESNWEGRTMETCYVEAVK